MGGRSEAISKFARELSHRQPKLHSQVDPDIIQHYVEREGAGCFSNTTPNVSR
jgi:hypothetical protein